MGELIELGDGLGLRVITVQIMRPGTFVDMSGRAVTITPQDLDTYVNNFAAGVAGQQLPVFFGHPAPAGRAAEPAAAWFRSLVVQQVDGEPRLVAEIELSDIGQAALEGGRYRYFSPTIDLEAKVLRGGGFVNLPAIKGLPAIELGAFLVEVTTMDDFGSRVVNVLRDIFNRGNQEAGESGNQEGGEPMDEEKLREQIRAELTAEFAAQVQAEHDLAERVRAEERAKVLAELTERAALEKECADLAASLTGGEAGLSTPVDEVKAFLLSLSPEQRAVAHKLLSQKVVDFSEKGHTGAGAKKEALPKLMADTLREWLKGRPADKLRQSVELFCEANGISAAQYDLSEWLPVDK